MTKTEKEFNDITITRNNTNFRLFLEATDVPKQNFHLQGVEEVQLSHNCESRSFLRDLGYIKLTFISFQSYSE